MGPSEVPKDAMVPRSSDMLPAILLKQADDIPDLKGHSLEVAPLIPFSLFILSRARSKRLVPGFEP